MTDNNIHYEVETRSDLMTVACVFMKTKRKDLLKELKLEAPCFINNSFDFSIFLSIFDEEHRTELYKVLEYKIGDILNTASDLYYVLAPLNKHQRLAISKQFLSRILPRIESATDFSKALEFLNNKQRTEVFTDLKERIPEVIDSGSGFKYFLEFLNDKQRTEVYEIMKDSLEDFIIRSKKMDEVLMYLNEVQRTEVYERVKKHIAQLDPKIEWRDGLDKTPLVPNFEYLNEKQREEALHIYTEEINRKEELLYKQERERYVAVITKYLENYVLKKSKLKQLTDEQKAEVLEGVSQRIGRREVSHLNFFHGDADCLYKFLEDGNTVTHILIMDMTNYVADGVLKKIKNGNC